MASIFLLWNNSSFTSHAGPARRGNNQDLWSALETTMASVVFLDSQCLALEKKWRDVEGAHWMKYVWTLYELDGFLKKGSFLANDS